MITERDIKILEFINEFGFCGLEQIMLQFGIKSSNAYKIMKRLMRKGQVYHEHIFHGKKGVYYLSKEGASFTDLPPLTKVPEYQHRHHFKVIELYIKFMLRNPKAHWISERWLIKDYKKKKQDNIKHVPDAKIILPEGKQVAIEVELTRKKILRLEKIFSHYVKQNDIDEAWYFCAPGILPFITEIAGKRTFIKIFNLEEYLNERSI